jgi:hypothetical protein
MDRFCPACRVPTPGNILCPACGGQTDVGGNTPEATRGPGERGSFGFWPRLLIGLVLAQGLYFGLRQAVNAAVLAGGSADFWGSFPGLLTAQGLQAAALLAGSMVAGAGHSRGLLAGGLLGLWNAAILLMTPMGPALPRQDILVFGLPTLHAFVGAAGGLIGGLIWRPFPGTLDLGPADEPAVPMLDDLPAVAGLGRQPEAPLLPEVKAAPRPRPDPVAWDRVVGGVALGVGGTLWAHVLCGFVIRGGGASVDREQTRFVAWEISALALFAAGTMGGSNSRGGALRGLIVGAVAASVLAGARAGMGGPPLPVQEYLIEALGGQPSAAPPGLALALLVMHAVGLATFGGWFGSLLMPPLAPPRARPSRWYE